MNKAILNLIFSLLIIVQASAMNHNDTGISIHNPWIRSAPPNTPVLGMFMQVDNQTDKEVKLIAVDADGYKRVEIHKTLNENGIMKMLKQPFAPIPAKKKLHFKPGSWHIMLIKPKQVPSIGSVVSIKLKFDNEIVQTVQADVRSGQKMHKKSHEY